MVVALASWAGETEDVTLIFDDAALTDETSTARAASIKAPAIRGFQPAMDYAPGEAITLEPQRGLLLMIGY
jgi:hypothetical protein